MCLQSCLKAGMRPAYVHFKIKLPRTSRDPPSIHSSKLLTRKEMGKNKYLIYSWQKITIREAVRKKNCKNQDIGQKGGWVWFQILISFSWEIVTYITGGWVPNTVVIILSIQIFLLKLAFFHLYEGRVSMKKWEILFFCV